MRPRLRSMIVVALLAGALIGVSSVSARADSEVYLCRHQRAADLAEAVRALLSPDGALTVDGAQNRLIIRDTPAVIADIRKLLARLDVPPPVVKLRVSLIDAQFLDTLGAGIRWTSSGGWRTGVIETAGKGPARVVTDSAQATEHEYRVQAGRAVTIPMAGEIPADRVGAIALGRGLTAAQLDSARARAEWALTPSVLGDSVLVTAIPAVTITRGPGERVRRLDSAALTARCPDGGTILLAAEPGGATGDWLRALGVESGIADGTMAWRVDVRLESGPTDTGSE